MADVIVGQAPWTATGQWQPLLALLIPRITAYSPRVHANGFIQFDVTPSVRLHVWDNSQIPCQDPPTPVHDHRFGFTSRVVVGELLQVAYRPQPLGVPTAGGRMVAGQWNALCESIDQPAMFYVPHRAELRQGEDTALHPQPEMVKLQRDGDRAYGPACHAQEYRMAPYEVHQTVVRRPSVSVIVKDGPTLSQGGPPPTVYVPYGVTPDNAFDRHAAMPQAEQWEIMNQLIAQDPQAVALGLAWALLQEAR